MKKEYRQISDTEHLFRSCSVMLKHALDNGYNLPAALVNDFYSISTKHPDLTPLRINHKQMLSDSKPMLFEPQEIRVLSSVHSGLVRVISPAKPYTLMLLSADSAKEGKWQVFGSVPLLRRLLAAATICILAMILFGGFSDMQAYDKNLFDLRGIQLLLNFGFLLAAAGLGAAFSGLFKARAYVSNYTYDSQYEDTYWTEFALGLIAGIILAEIIDVGDVQAVGIKIGSKVTLAMLGGFSGMVVYRLLNRVVYALEALVKQRTEDKFSADLRQLESKSNERISVTRTNIAREITKIQSDLSYKTLTQDDVNRRLEGLVDGLVFDDYQSPNDKRKVIVPQTMETEDEVEHTNLDSPEHDDEEYTAL